MNGPLPESNNELSAGEARIAKLHVRHRFGEALSEAERAELEGAAAAHAALLAELDRTGAALEEAFAESRPSPSFSRNVLDALDASSVAKASTAAPSPLPPDGSGRLRVFSGLPEEGEPLRRRRWFLAACGVAALLALTLGGLLVSRLFQEQEAAPHLARATPPDLRIVKGRNALRDRQGQPVTALEAGRWYRVKAGGEALIETGAQSMLRLMEETSFRPLSKEDHARVMLREGMLYAAGSGPEPLVVRSPAFETAVKGVSMVAQEEVPPEGAPNEEGFGQGIVIVFQGSARVRAAAGSEALTLGAGEMVVSGLPSEPVEVFLAQARRRARGLEEWAGDPEGLRARRQLYRERVQGYRRDLARLNKALAHTPDSPKKSEMERRRKLILSYLGQHRRRLKVFVEISEGRNGEAPLRRAQRLRRAARRVAYGKKAYRDPESWK